MHWNPQSLGDRDQFEVGDGPVAALDLRDLRLVHFDPEPRKPRNYVVLRDLWRGRDPQSLDVLASDVASFTLGIQSALEGAPILLLFRTGIILLGNKSALCIVPKSNQPLTVLCVDEHTLVGDALTKVFRTAGYKVERAEDGESAWHKLAPDPGHFDVLVTDHQMPRLDGLGLVTRLRDIGFAGRIIVYSGSLTDVVARQYQDLAVDAIVVKAPDAARLLAVVEAFNQES